MNGEGRGGGGAGGNWTIGLILLLIRWCEGREFVKPIVQRSKQCKTKLSSTLEWKTLYDLNWRYQWPDCETFQHLIVFCTNIVPLFSLLNICCCCCCFFFWFCFVCFVLFFCCFFFNRNFQWGLDLFQMVEFFGLRRLSDPGNFPLFSEDAKLHDNRTGSIASGMNKYSSRKTLHEEILYLVKTNNITHWYDGITKNRIHRFPLV